MKIKKLLPLLMAAMLISPAFAEDGPAGGTYTGNVTTPTEASVLQLTVPAYINITKVDTGSKYTSETQTIGQDYSSLTAKDNLIAKFKVATNNKGVKVSLTGQSMDNKKALFDIASGGNAGLYLVLANTSSETAPSATDIANAGALEDGSKSPNAIAFKVSYNCTADTGSGGTAPTEAGSPDSTGTITYTLDNGIYNFTYTLDTEAQSFNTRDENGIYKAKLTMSHVSFH